MPPLDRRIAGRALRFALPLMLADSLESLLWLVDAYFVSLLGEEALAAVGVGGYLGWLWFIGSSLYMTGVLVVASQAFGAGERRLAGRAVSEGFTASLLLGIPAATLGYLLAPTLVGLVASGASEAVRAEAVGYFRVRVLGIPLVYAAMSLDAGFRAAERSRPIAASVAVGAVVNALLDPPLILGLGPLPGLGVRGAALASIVAGAASLAVLLAYRRHLEAPFRPAIPGRLAFAMARVGAPALAERLAFVLGNVAYLSAVAYCGDAALAAHTIGVRLESLAFIPLFSLGTAAATMVGQEVGAGRMGEAKRIGWELAKLSALAGGAVGALLALLAPLAPGAFTDDPVVAGLARDYLLIAAASEPSLAAVFSLGQAIRGAGNTLVPTVVNLAGIYLVRVAPAMALVRLLPLGSCVYGAWLAMLVDVVARSAAFALVYRLYFERLARKLV